MSVLDELTGLEEKVRARMTELRPLLDEYSELQKAAERLGIATDATVEPQQRRAGSGRRRAPKAARKPAAPQVSATAAADDGAPEAAPSRSRAKTQAKPKKPSSRASTKKSRQPGGSRSGQRAEQLAALVRRRPGLTVKDAGAEFGVDPTSLYRVIKQLESDGKLEKRGRELHPT